MGIVDSQSDFNHQSIFKLGHRRGDRRVTASPPNLDPLISSSLVFLRLPLDTPGRGFGDMAFQVVIAEDGVSLE